MGWLRGVGVLQGLCRAWAGAGLTVEGVLLERVLADGVKDRVECPVQHAQQQQQQQNGQCPQELPHLCKEPRVELGHHLPWQGAPSGALCLPPSAACLWLCPQSCAHTVLTKFFVSSAWMVGLQGKMTVFSSALWRGSRVCLPWKTVCTEEPWGSLPFPLCPHMSMKPTQDTQQGRALPAHQPPPALIDLIEVGADVDVVKANVPIIAIHVGEGPVDGWLGMCHLLLQGSSPTPDLGFPGGTDTEPPTNQGSLSTHRS